MLNRSKFLNAPLNDGMKPVRMESGKPCYCIVGAYIHAYGVDDDHIHTTYHNEYAFRHLDDVPDQVISVLVQAEKDLMKLTRDFHQVDDFKVSHHKLTERQAMDFKLDVLNKLIAAGVKLEEETTKAPRELIHA